MNLVNSAKARLYLEDEKIANVCRNFLRENICNLSSTALALVDISQNIYIRSRLLILVYVGYKNCFLNMNMRCFWTVTHFITRKYCEELHRNTV